MSVAVIVALAGALGIPWLDKARSPVLPPTGALASQLLADPEAVHRVQVGYLSTSWQDTEGTHHTLTGLPEIAARAASPGPDGHAARAGLARIDDALQALLDRDPQIARQVAGRVAHGVHPDVLATHLPAAHALVHNQ